MDSEALTCRELVELVTDFLEGALSPRDRLRFERHLGRCGGCRGYLAQVRDTLRLAGRITPDALPAAVLARLLAAFRGWRGARPGGGPARAGGRPGRGGGGRGGGAAGGGG